MLCRKSSLGKDEVEDKVEETKLQFISLSFINQKKRKCFLVHTLEPGLETNVPHIEQIHSNQADDNRDK